MPRKHVVKSKPQTFALIAAGEQTYELRRNDRDFATGDQMLLREWNPETGYTGRELLTSIISITPREVPCALSDVDLHPDYCIFNIEQAWGGTLAEEAHQNEAMVVEDDMRSVMRLASWVERNGGATWHPFLPSAESALIIDIGGERTPLPIGATVVMTGYGEFRVELECAVKPR